MPDKIDNGGEAEREEKLILSIKEARDYLRENPPPKMTQTSRQMRQDAIRIRDSKQAYAYLKENPPFRRLKDILIAADKQSLTEMELKRKLADGICANHPDQKRDGVERKIRNWFSGKTQSIGRDTAFELCLILGLDVKEADRFIMGICDEAIHWRNPAEITWGYAIENHLSYAEAQELIASAQRVSLEGKQDASVRTSRIRSEVMDVLQGTKEELLEYLAANRERWGRFHNEAYGLFLSYMQILETGLGSEEELQEKKRAKEEAKKRKQDEEKDEDEDGRMTVDRILETYFFSSRISSSALDGIQKSIKANWPDATVLSKMKNRSDNVDVSRKVLILLFLATNGSETAYMSLNEAMGIGEEHMSREQVFKDLYMRLNLMLTRCGFRTLDPRSPFDWIILYSIAVDDVIKTDRRLNEIFEKMFEDDGNKDQED